MADAYGYNNGLGSHGNLIKVTSQACVHNSDTYAHLYTTITVQLVAKCFLCTLIVAV